MVLDILQVLDNIQVDHNDEISEADRAFCENLQSQFDNIKSMLGEIGKANDEILNRTMLEKENEHNEWREIFSDLHDEAEKVAELVKEGGRKIFINRILHYFANTYCVEVIRKIDFRPLHGKVDLHWRDVLKLILKEVGSIGLNHAGKEQIISRFRKLCERRHDRAPQMVARLGKNVLKLGRVFLLSGSDYRGLHINFRNEATLATILHALHYFESNDLELDSHYAELSAMLLKMEGNIWLKPVEIDSEKVVGLRFYQNDRVDIRFQTEAHREAFIAMFGLSRLIAEQADLMKEKHK